MEVYKIWMSDGGACEGRMMPLVVEKHKSPSY